MDTEQAIGRVAGYPYRKAQATSHITIALPGQIDEGDPSVSHLLVLYGSRTESGPMEYDPPEAQKDDALVMDGGARYRVLSVMDVLDGAYQVYRLKEV